MYQALWGQSIPETVNPQNSAYLGIGNTMLRGQCLELDTIIVHSGRYLIQEGQEYNE